ncbi:MAG: hemolysin family protein [bacterium]
MEANLLGLIGLLIMSAFFSGSETALMSVNMVTVKDLANKGDKRAKLLDELLKEKTKLLTTILIGNNLANIAASAIATSIAIEVFGRKGIGITTGIMTFLVLLFGEITPKSLGSRKALAFSRTVAPYLFYLEKICYPIIIFFTWIINFVLGKEKLQSSRFLSEDEIKKFIKVSSDEGIIKRVESDMINNVFAFDDIKAKDIMITKDEIVCVKENEKLSNLIQIASKCGFSRIPVYKESVNNIVGLVYVKDLINVKRNESKCNTIKKFIRPVYFISEHKTINKVLAGMKQQKIHMAIIKKENGDIAGLITIEDLIEEIVGDIQDEYDRV